MAICPVCGFDAPSLSPPDAVVALRSLPRRFREAAAPERGAGADDMAGAAARAAVVATHASAAAVAITAAGERLRLVLIEDSPMLASRAEPPAATPADPLAGLAAAATAVADLAADQPAGAWTRTGRRDGVTVSAADLLRDAVHAGVHELRLASADAPTDEAD